MSKRPVDEDADVSSPKRVSRCSNDLMKVWANWKALRDIENQTHELCTEAVKQNGDALKYVQTQTPELCMEAVKQRGSALRFVKTQTPELCKAAIRQNPKEFQFVEEKERTKDVMILYNQLIAYRNQIEDAQMIRALETRLPRDACLLVMEYANEKPYTA